MRRILREPLLHFLLLGAALFAAHRLLSDSRGGEPGRIVVTKGDVTSLVVGFTRAWQRPPTREELDGLVRERVREEVYCREAMALGLDKDDTIIRRRLRQKMEFLTDDLLAQAPPTDDELRAYLAAHPDPFRVQRRFTFRHVYLDPGRHGDRAGRDAADLLAHLRRLGAGADVSTLGDRFLLDHAFDGVPAAEVAKIFGDQFAAALGDVPPGEWQGPVASGYGIHLVFVDERAEGHAPALDEVRDAVTREWAEARRREANEKLYAEMLGRYEVTIEASDAGPRSVADN